MGLAGFYCRPTFLNTPLAVIGPSTPRSRSTRAQRPAPNSRGDVTVEDRPTVLTPEAIVQRRDVFRERFDIVDCGQVPAGLVVFD